MEIFFKVVIVLKKKKKKKPQTIKSTILTMFKCTIQ